MEIDNYEIWEPVDGITSDIYFYDLQYNGENLTVLLKQLNIENKTLIIKFESVLGYRIVNESVRLKTIHKITTFGGFKTSTDSEFLRWFLEESGGLFDGLKLKHFLICNIDNIIDVITALPATAEWVTVE